MPKPRPSGRSFLTEGVGGIPNKGSHQDDQQSKQHDIFSNEHADLSKSSQKGSNTSTTGTFSRGKKPVPLPRRLSTISTGDTSVDQYQPETPQKSKSSTSHKTESHSESKTEVKTPSASSDGRRSNRTSISTPSQTQGQSSENSQSVYQVLILGTILANQMSQNYLML